MGGRGSGDGQFLRPAGVAIGPDGTLYVTDHFNDRVERFSGDGRFQAQLGTVQANVTPSVTPTGLAIAAIATTSTPTVVATTPVPTVTVGQTVVASTLPDAQLRRPEGLVLDRDGNLWVADYGRDRVVKLGPDGRLLQSWGNRGSGPGEFIGPKGVAIDPSSGHVYVADTGNARIQRFAPDGMPELSWPMPAVPAPPVTSPAP
jgi:tripartite motif-containing protein 71